MMWTLVRLRGCAVALAASMVAGCAMGGGSAPPQSTTPRYVLGGAGPTPTLGVGSGVPLLAEAAPAMRNGGASVDVWLHLGPASGVRLETDQVTLTTGNDTLHPAKRNWRACKSANDCAPEADVPGAASIPVHVDGIAWVHLRYDVNGPPPIEFTLQLAGLHQGNVAVKPISLEFRLQ